MEINPIANKYNVLLKTNICLKQFLLSLTSSLVFYFILKINWRAYRYSENFWRLKKEPDFKLVQ